MQTQKKQNFIEIKNQRFHYVWLRDNCICPKCRHSSSFQNIYDISEATSPPQPISVEEIEGKLIVVWDENPPHRSEYPISWLLDNAYDPEPDSLFESDILWDKAWIEANPPAVYDVHSCDQESWMNQVFQLGFALLKNLEFDQLDAFVSSIGPVHQWECGRFDTIKPTENGRDITYLADRPLWPHTDSSHRYDTRLIEFLYCVENETLGGETLVLDGFRIAEDFRKNHPKQFRILAETPVQFRHYEVESGYFFCRITPILELDAQGKMAGICFSHKNCTRNLPFEQVEGYYEAYSMFFRALKDPAYQFRFRLEPGDCLVMKNFRILHGRTPYVSNSGKRHLEVGYTGWHYLAGRRNYSKFKHLYFY